MTLSKLSFILNIAIIFLWNNTAYAQSSTTNVSRTTKNTPKITMTFNLQKRSGVGPSGNMSYGISSFNPDSDTEEVRGYPKVKNKPTGLHGEVQYYYKLNDFQFHYQNYCAGIYSKNYFLGKAREQQWNLADTVRLSRKSIKCGFSVLAGYNDSNEAVCIIDGDNDNDFSNDALKPLLKYTPRTHAEGSIPILTEYLSGEEIKQERISVLTKESNGSNNEKTDLELMFSFPEFKYARFIYKAQSYFICTDYSGMGRKFIYVMPDVPNFEGAAAETKIGINQFVHIGDKDFMFLGFEDNGNKINIAVDDSRDFSSIFSNQMGYKAPIIKGYNFVNTEFKDLPLISSADLKGKYIFVDFWSTSCAPCIAEFPYLKEAYLKYDRENFEIIGILDERSPSVTARLLKEGNLIWPNIRTNKKGTEVNGYNINSYPTSYLIDREGIIIAVNLRGEELINKLKTLIK